MRLLKKDQIILIESNMHVLFTRPLEDCHEMILKFKSLGNDVSHLPLISIEGLKHEVFDYFSPHFTNKLHFWMEVITVETFLTVTAVQIQ